MSGLDRTAQNALVVALGGTLVLASLVFGMARYAPVPPSEASAVLNGSASGGVTVEIVAPHDPVSAAATAALDRALAAYGERVHVVRYDPTTPSGATFAHMKGVRGSLPLVVFVNGTQTFQVAGRKVTFENLPGAGGAWTVDELDTVLHDLAGN